MSALNLQVIMSTCSWIEQGDRVFFITVLNTWGASPRPIGSLLAYNLDKEIQSGSLSGGCIEDDLFDFFINNYKEKGSILPSYFIKIYGATAEEGIRYQLPCGGTLELLIESITGSTDYEHFVGLKRALLARQPIARSVCLDEPSSKQYITQYEQILGAEELVFNRKINQFYHRLDPSYQLLLVGIGDVTLYVCELAETLGFDVTICEPRVEYNKRFQSANLPYKIFYDLPDDLIKLSFLDSFSAILCLAHDPKLDDMALLEGLTNSSAFYIGAMGSLKTSNSRFERLKALGLTPLQLKRLDAPIGLNIHSKTPQEISVAICAELIASRYRHRRLNLSK